ncbi:MAG: hypothetical protein GEU99_13015 [Luteitalea sp.]|nr:hypothetical protein [Luteitalea sp.]
MLHQRSGVAVSVLALHVVLFWAPGVVLGQTTFATITGTVVDPSGSAVPGVEIEAVHVQSNYRYSAVSNDMGYYTISQLREGSYLLRARLAGFKEGVVRGIVLDSRDIRRVDITLELGEVEAQVEVTAGATLIETETPRLSDTKTADVLRSLPINTRSLWNFMALSPTVVASPLGAYRRFGGSRLNQSDAAIDGITTSNMYDGTQISPLTSYIDSYQEVRVDTANNSAEYGAIGMVNVISKSGTNEFHGSVFDYYQTPLFRARNPFALERGTGVLHEPGGTVGGPVRIPGLYEGRDRTFFFFSYETRRGSTIQQLLDPTVPLESWRSGDFSDLDIVIRDPFDNGNPFPNNQIPTSRINPTAQTIQERFYPLPNFGDTTRFSSQNYREMMGRPLDPSTYWTSRIDHRFSERAFVFGRFTWNRSHNRPFEGNLPTIGQRWQQRDTRAVNISYTHTITPALVSESRWGFAFNNNPRQGPLMGQEVVSSLGIEGLADGLPDIPGIFQVSFSDIGLTGINQQFWRNPGFRNYANQFQQHISWYLGQHSIKAGMVLERVEFTDHIASENLFGHAAFSSRFTGHPYADFLLGIPTSTNRAFPPVRIDRVRWATNLFVTDEMRLHPRLTLTLGLRYEYGPSWIEKNDRQSMFDITTGKIVVPDGALDQVSPLMPRGYVDVIEASEAGLPGRTLLKTDRNNIAPRIGVGWRPFGSDTVFRAGYGIFYDVVPRAVAAADVPFVINEPTFTNPADDPVVLLPRVFPSSVAGPSTVDIPNAYRPDLRIPYSQQWNLTIEHQRWDTGFRLSYIGTNTRQGEWSYNINQPVPDNRLFIDKVDELLFPEYPAMTITPCPSRQSGV